jgi:hypothetical protein
VSYEAPEIPQFSRMLFRHWLWRGSIMAALREMPKEMPRDGRLIGKLPTQDRGE